MNRIYVYQIDESYAMADVIDFCNRSDIEVDIHRIKHKKKLYVRVPAGCSHSLFILRFGDVVSLVDMTWEVDFH